MKKDSDRTSKIGLLMLMSMHLSSMTDSCRKNIEVSHEKELREILAPSELLNSARSRLP